MASRRNQRHDDHVVTQAEQRLDGGYTLIEILVAVVLMGTVVLSIMGGMWAVVRASSQNDSRAKVQAILGGAGDRIVAADYKPCPEIDNSYLVSARQAAVNVGWTADLVTLSYRYWDPADATWKPTNNVSGSGCNEQSGLTPNKTIQLVTVTATAPNGQYSNSLDVVKADIRAKEVRDVTIPNP